MGTDLRLETDIAAEPETVWGALADTAAWSSWNPTLFDVRGALEPGSVVHMKLRSGRLKIPMRQKIVEVTPPRRLVWRSLFGPTWLMSVTRGFQISATDGGGSRLVQFENGTGLVAPVVFALMGSGFSRGHRELARALGSRVARSAG